MELSFCRDNLRNSRLIQHNKYKPFFLLRTLLLFTISGILLLPGAEGKLTIQKECGEIICKPHNYCSNHDESCRPCQEACDPALGNYDKSVCERDCQDYLHDLWYMRKPENDSAPRLTEELYVDLYYKMQEDLRLLKILIGVVIILSTLVMMALFAVMIYFKHLKSKLGISHSNREGMTNDDDESGEKNNKKKQKNLMDLPVIYSNNRVLSLPIHNLHNDKGPPSHVSTNSINNNLSRGSTPDLVSKSVTSLNSSSLPTTQNLKKPSSANMTQSERQQKMRREPSESTLPEYHAYDNPALVPSPTHM